MAYVALFIALGGSSYAAVTITGRNVKNSSLTGRDIKNNSIASADVKGLKSRDVTNGSLLARDFKRGQLPRGPRGLNGDKGTKGDKGDKGLTGSPGPTAASSASRSADVGITTTPVEVLRLSGTGGGGRLVTSFPARLMINGAVTIGNGAGDGEFSIVTCQSQLNGGSGFTSLGSAMSTESIGNNNHDEKFDVPVVASTDRPAGTSDVRIVCFSTFASAASKPIVRTSALNVVAVAR